MRRIILLALALLPAAAGCGGRDDDGSASRTEAGGDLLPRFEGLGALSRPVTTDVPQAQGYFDQGLAFLYAFNHDEAIRSFRQAAALDSGCAMAYWGVSLANGPHINNPVLDEAHARAAWEALERARSCLDQESPLEHDLVEALGARYADPPPEDRKALDEAYAAAMRGVWESHPQDPDVGALFAEALMDLRPWDQWQPDGTPQPGTEEVISTLERVFELEPNHPLANHLYIHAVEASHHPERAMAAADRLRDLQPGLGHLVHMPSHIDVRTGRWHDAEIANRKALAADSAYRAVSPVQGFYRLYMAHNYHMLTYAAMMQGESALALETIRDMTAGMPPEWLEEHAYFADGFMAMPLEVMMRFGKWDEILAEPEFPDYLPLATALRHYARGVAFAAQGMVEEAKAEQSAFQAAKARVPEEWIFGNNAAHDLVNLAERFLAGEVLYRAGRREEGVAALREAVRLEDALRYDEPPGWIQPVRHALGAVLLEMGRFAEAEAVYREDLAKLPGNGWSLFGMARSLEMQGKEAEASEFRARFDSVWVHADVKLSSSCFCLPGV